MSLSSPALLFRNDPILVRNAIIPFLPALFLGPATANADVAGLLIKTQGFRGLSALRRRACGKDEEVLLGLCTIGIIDKQAATKACAHGGCREQLHLRDILGIKLENGTCALPEGSVKGSKESIQSLPRVMLGSVSIAQPLNSGNGDSAIEGAHAEGDALSCVCDHKIACDVAFQGFLKHGEGDVGADPVVTCVGEDVAGETCAGADVEKKGGLGRREGEELETAGGESGLDLGHAGAGGVLGGARGGVELRGRGGVLGTAGGHGGLEEVLPSKERRDQVVFLLFKYCR